MRLTELDDSMDDVAGLPPVMRAMGAISGIPVIVQPYLRYDEMFIMPNRPVIAVGEIAHFRYRLRQIRLNNECRRIARERIERRASQLLGEPWTVLEK